MAPGAVLLLQVPGCTDPMCMGSHSHEQQYISGLHLYPLALPALGAKEMERGGHSCCSVSPWVRWCQLADTAFCDSVPTCGTPVSSALVILLSFPLLRLMHTVSGDLAC